MQPLNVTEAFGPGWWDVGMGLRDLETAHATRLCDHEYDLTVLGVSMYYGRELSNIFHLFIQRVLMSRSSEEFR